MARREHLTTTSAFDDFFEYTLTDPITIRKNESALVPILQTKLPVERVTLWSASEPVSLRALWITNASSLTLDRGSFSIVEDGSFGGEGLLEDLALLGVHALGLGAEPPGLQPGELERDALDLGVAPLDGLGL